MTETELWDAEELPAEDTVHEGISDGSRLDVQLAALSGLSRSRAASLAAEGLCLVDGRPETKAGARPRTGAAIVLTVPAPRPALPQPENIPLTILFEDEALAVVVKPAGMVTHPAAGNPDGTLVNALLYHLDHLGSIGGQLRPGIVHRLDKDTSGLLLVAKNDAAQQALSAMLAARQIEKHYRALVEGSLRESAGTVDAPIARSKTDRKKMAVDPAGRSALTDWTVLAEGRGCSLLDVRIHTGRTHQIRVHMKHIGHPVCGDPIYGNPRGVKVPRLMLHAHSLRLRHPLTGEALAFTAPLPEAFAEGLRKNGIDPAALP